MHSIDNAEPSTPTALASVSSTQSHRKNPSRVWLIVCVLLAAGMGVFWFTSAGAKTSAQAPKRSAPIIPVVAATAKTGDIGVYLNALGTITPINHVTVKPRVDGELMAVHFVEGQLVKAGELLAEIDPRPLEALVAQAEGQIARDEALLKNASLDLKRYVALSTENTISQQALSAQEALVAQLEAERKSHRAELDSAKIRLSYARITAPLSGRVGFRQLDPGNMVRASDAAGLVSITQDEPITAVFAIAQDHLPPVFRKWSAGEKLIVEAYDRGQKTKLSTGHLLTLDNQIDPSTGTLKCKAVFTNEDRALFPNQFVNIRLLVEQKRAVTLVPAGAIQRGAQQSSFVYVAIPEAADAAAKPDGKTAGTNAQAPVHVVAIRPVTAGTSEGDFVEITEGLQAGEVVVLEGVDRLQSDSKISLRQRDNPAASRASAAAAASTVSPAPKS